MRGLLCIATVCLLAACGGGGGGSATPPAGGGTSPTAQTGVFIDSAVEGVRFETATQSGLTDASGTFQYLSGETVSFFIGDILIGTATGGSQVTPLDFVPGATDAANPQVTNILRFVQSLDEDNNPDNGIRITAMVRTQASGQALDFSLDASAFETAANALLNVLTSGSVTALISALDAQTHFNISIGVGGGGFTVSGADTSGVGTNFNSTISAAVFFDPDNGSVSWAPSPGKGLTLSVVNGAVRSLIFISVDTSNLNNVYSYLLSCLPDPTVCAGASVDVANKRLTLQNVSLPVSLSVGPNLTNLATAPLVFDGALTWE